MHSFQFPSNLLVHLKVFHTFSYILLQSFFLIARNFEKFLMNLKFFNEILNEILIYAHIKII